MEKGSTTRAAPLLFTLLFLLFSSVILGDNVADSLLLSHYDASVFPIMFMVNAAFLFTVSAFFMGLIDRFDRGMLLLSFVGVHLFMLVSVRLAMNAGLALAYPFLYSYAYASKMVLFMIFWTVVNDIVDARDAKVLFPKIAAGGVLGGILVSFASAYFAQRVGAEGLVVIWIAILLLTLPIIWVLHGRFLPQLRAIREPSAGSSFFDRFASFGLLKNDRLLRHMSLIYFLTFILLYAQDFIFLSTLRENFLRMRVQLLDSIDVDTVTGVMKGVDVETVVLKRAIPSFLGMFKGAANSLTLILQFTVAGWVLRSLGTVRAMLVMPLCFVFVYGLILLSKVFGWSGWVPDGYPFFGNFFFLLVLTGLAFRIALFDAVYSPNFQIFFSALNKDIRGKGKILVEGLVKPFAILSAGLFILFVYREFPSFAMVLLFVFSLILVVVGFQMRHSYTESIAKSLGEGREERLRHILEDPHKGQVDTVPLLKRFLDDDDPEIADFATLSLARLPGEEPVRLLWGRFSSADGMERIRFLKMLAPLRDSRYLRLFEAGLYDREGEAVAAAMEALMLSGTALDTTRFTRLLSHPHPQVRARAAAGLWKSAAGHERVLLEAIIRELLASGEPGALEAGLTAAAAAEEPALWNAVEPGLARAWGFGTVYRETAITTAGAFNDARACRYLLSCALKLEGTELDSLAKALSVNFVNQLDVVAEAFRDENDVVRHTAVKALMLRKEVPSDALAVLLEDLLDWEVRRLFQYEAYANSLNPDHDGEMILASALRERKIRGNLGHFIRITAALLPTAGLQSAAGRVSSINRHVRASALELLDSATVIKPVRLFLRFCDNPDADWVKEVRNAQWQEGVPARYFVMKVLVEETDHWIRSLVLYAALESDRRTGSSECLEALGLNRVNALSRLSEAVYG